MIQDINNQIDNKSSYYLYHTHTHIYMYAMLHVDVPQSIHFLGTAPFFWVTAPLLF